MALLSEGFILEEGHCLQIPMVCHPDLGLLDIMLLVMMIQERTGIEEDRMSLAHLHDMITDRHDRCPL